MIGTGVSRALAGVTIAAVAAATALAFFTIHPPPLKAKSRPARPSQVTARPAPPAEISVPQSEPPPAPTLADFGVTKPAAPPARTEGPSSATDWAALPLDELRARANASDIPAMEELGRRLIEGIDAAKDPQAGAGWLLRAAKLGSAQSAFNVGVMYERGFVVERDSTKAVEWYRKAADANLAVAKHNLALLLRDGKGAPRDGKAAIELLQSAAHQGMAASMFSLGDIYDRGDAAPRDATAALAWFAVAAEFERQANRGADTPLAITASQRVQALRRTLTPAELAQAQELAQREFRTIVDALNPPKPPPEPPEAEPNVSEPSSPAASSPNQDVAAWPNGAADQVRAVQQVLFDLKLLRDKPDGNLGPVTRAAIRDFQKSTGLRQTGEASKDVYFALRLARAQRDVVANSPLPMPPQVAAATEPKPEPAKPEPPKPEVPKEVPKTEVPKAEPPKQQAERIDLPPAELPPPPTSADIARVEPKPEPPKPELPKVEPPKVEPPTADLAKVDPPKPPMPPITTAKPEPTKVAVASPPPPSNIDIGATEPPPPPPTSADIARLAAKTDPDAWPANRIDQVKVIQGLLRDMKLYTSAIDGLASVATRSAIRDYERMAGLKETGEPSKVLFDSLKEMRSLMAPKPGATAN